MRSYRRNPIVRLVVVGMASWQWGCAVTRPIAAAIPPSPEVRAQLGVVSVVSASEAPRTDLIGPTRGRGALRGVLATAGPGAMVGLLPGASQFRADLAVTADSLARQIVEALLAQGSSEELASRESSDVTEGQP